MEGQPPAGPHLLAARPRLCAGLATTLAEGNLWGIPQITGIRIIRWKAGLGRVRNERGFDAEQLPESRVHSPGPGFPLLPDAPCRMDLVCTPVLSGSNAYSLRRLNTFPG